MSLPANVALVQAISQNNQPGNCLTAIDDISGTGTWLAAQNGGYARGIYVGVAGTVVVTLASSSAQHTLTNLAAGMWHPMAVTSVIISSGTTTLTTATDVHLGY